MIGSALVPFREREQLLLGIWEATFGSNVAKPDRQLSVMRPVQLPPVPIVAHRNSASNPTRTSAAVVRVASNAVCANALRVGSRASWHLMNSRSSPMLGAWSNYSGLSYGMSHGIQAMIAQSLLLKRQRATFDSLGRDHDHALRFF